MFSRNRGGNPNIAKRGAGPRFRSDDRVCPDGGSPGPNGMCGGSRSDSFVCPDGSSPGPDGMCGSRGMRKGGKAESKAMMKKEVAFMKKKGAPKSMLKHEMKEAGMKKMRSGGMAKSGSSYRKAADGIASRGKTKGKTVKMMKGGYGG